MAGGVAVQVAVRVSCINRLCLKSVLLYTLS